MRFLIVYLTIIGLGLLSMFVRRDTSLARGAGIFNLTVLFSGASIVLAVFLPALRDPFPLVFVGLAVLLYPLREHWLLVKSERGSTEETIEGCCRATLLEYARVEGGYRLGRKGLAEIRCHHANAVGLLVFRGVSGHAKARVLQRLLSKQFVGVLPRLVIQLKEDRR